MIGHVALFTAAFVAAAAAALGAPARTGSESCPAPVASSRAVVRTSTNLHRHGIAVGSRKSAQARLRHVTEIENVRRGRRLRPAKGACALSPPARQVQLGRPNAGRPRATAGGTGPPRREADRETPSSSRQRARAHTLLLCRSHTGNARVVASRSPDFGGQHRGGPVCRILRRTARSTSAGARRGRVGDADRTQPGSPTACARACLGRR
jgi:hypothetical protein